ncbi:major facilitator superfamily domain-containing protein 6-B-like [Hydractinia symbiolongicarpus]|uniref:major facilitator superfamily domain-containing protein 6-B-like n=1 Tax=Hydractinia symbiolongicarpus TaxID=13093 RepID=UPI00254ADDD1|nr:major facilitator superfamily domain-containing protein 6-B-like [Hydractinia symbiolongicarpus]
MKYCQNESISKPLVTWHKDVTSSEKSRLEKDECECVSSKNKTNVAKTLFSTCRQMKVIFFLIIVAHMGINFSLINGFQAIFMEKELGRTKTIIGLASALSSVSEILVFRVSAKLIKLFCGTYPSFIIATFSYCLRFLSMSFVEEPYLMVPIQLFQFFGFAIFWAAAVEYTNKISPIKISVTMFTIVTRVYYSLGNFTGSIVGGVIYDKYGGRWLSRASSINCGFLTGLIVLHFFLYERRRIHSSIDVPMNEIVKEIHDESLTNKGENSIQQKLRLMKIMPHKNFWSNVKLYPTNIICENSMKLITFSMFVETSTQKFKYFLFQLKSTTKSQKISFFQFFFTIIFNQYSRFGEISFSI